MFYAFRSFEKGLFLKQTSKQKMATIRRLASSNSLLIQLVKSSKPMRQYSSIACLLINNSIKQTKITSTYNLLNLNKNFNLNSTTIRYYSDKKLEQSDVEAKVLNIFNSFDRIKENAKVKVSLESHVIKDLGLDSLDHVEIIVQLEDTFGFEIPDSDYEKLYTPKEIVNYILKRSEL